jgi:hypothetical protein
VIFANIWRGVPFVAITLLAGLQTISPSLYEAATLDGATPWQRFRFITYPLLTPIIAVVMTFSVLFTFTDFQLIYALTRGGPVNATHLMATLSFQRGIPGGQLGEGAAIATAMIPFLLAAIAISYFGLQRASGSRALTMTDHAAITDSRRADRRERRSQEGMAYLESLPRRVVTTLHPAVHHRGRAAVPVLLDGDHLDQTRRRADRHGAVQSVLGDRRPSSTFKSCCSRPTIRSGCGTRCIVAAASTPSVAGRQRARRLCDRAAALPGAETVGALIFMAYLVPPSILFIPLASVIQAWPVRLAAGR